MLGLFTNPPPNFTSNTLDGRIDEVMPLIRHHSEDLREVEYYASTGKKPWLEFRDDATFLEQTLHFFNADNSYYLSVNGNVTRGTWELMSDTNKIMISTGDLKKPFKEEIFELVFLSEAFFILRKHGAGSYEPIATEKAKKRKYLVMGYEPATEGLQWDGYVEALLEAHKKPSHFGCLLFAAMVVVFLLYQLSF